MKRLCEILRIMFDRAFWLDFIEADMHEEIRMMHGRPVVFLRMPLTLCNRK